MTLSLLLRSYCYCRVTLLCIFELFHSPTLALVPPFHTSVIVVVCTYLELDQIDRTVYCLIDRTYSYSHSHILSTVLHTYMFRNWVDFDMIVLT